MGVQPRPIPTTGLDHFCWPAGQTPDVIKVFVAGNDFGNTWNPGDGNPANGYFDMVRIHAGSTRWTSSPVLPYYTLDLTGAISRLRGRNDQGEQCFLHEDLYNTCKKYYNNQMRCAVNKFCQGNAWVTGYEFPWDIADLVMDASWKNPNFECFPMPNKVLAIRVARIHDATNIMIKFDSTL